MENTPPEKRRRRPPLACIACRRRKVRCDRKLPCQNCVRARRAASCSYVSDDRVEPREGTEGFEDGINGRHPQRDALSSVPFFTSTACNSNSSPEQLAERVKLLEQQLGQVINTHNGRGTARLELPSAHFNNANFNPPTASQFLGQEHWQVKGLGRAEIGVAKARYSRGIQGPNQEEEVSNTEEDPSTAGNVNAILAKSRYLGNSHWIHGVTLFPRLMLFLESLKSDKDSEGYKAVAQSKILGRQIKAMRVPQILSLEFGNYIPSRKLADELVETYLRTYETIFRVLHIPSFRLEYGRYWQNPKGARQAFVIQLQLCMAIGAVLQDDQFSLRKLAVRWVYEARFWLLQPSEKSRMNLSGLQVYCLVHLARDVVGVGSDLVWASAGSMMRMAIYIGLHRDPSHLPKMSLLAAETRRRVWNTVLEILLQSSMDSGGPPLIAMSDYDTKPPRNYNDEDLLRDTTDAEIPQPKPLNTFTDTSVQIGLARTFKVRVEIASYLNDFRSVTSYDKSLAINSELTAASRSLDALLRAYKTQDPGPSQFQLRAVEHLIQRYFLAIHLPWLGLAKDDPRYFFSRRLCVEAGLRHHRVAKTYKPDDPSERHSQPDDFGRLLICGSGSVRFIGTQCLLAATLEFVWELDERLEGARSLDFNTTGSNSTPSITSNSGVGMGYMGPMVDESEMLDVLRYTVTWMRARIKAGEVNVKGFLFATAVLAEAEGLTNDSSEEELKDVVRQACLKSAREALDLLKEMHTALSTDNSTFGVAEANMSASMNTEAFGPQVSGNEDAFNGMEDVELSSDWDWDITGERHAEQVRNGHYGH
ncbi:hypothetical protein J7T55_012848 [Diaporthe amygdali]|uniref:uncharacterized protein n=1 Tax=Phomopsis amygdali TaxID=1214568 RepID=UPI0022FEA201|nr:uncharacterized protein J7T55_012848 [Diaporthe amygdali]KAJ0118596.1 hypothetical protein J7T55_012848 [Diaporthe amygdali]